MIDQTQLTLIVLDSIKELDYKTKWAIKEDIAYKTFSEWVTERAEYIIKYLGTEVASKLKALSIEENAFQVVSDLRKKNIQPIALFSDEYPSFLRNIDNPPLVLYAKGNVKLLHDRLFTIVGSRKSLPISVKIAEKYARAINDAGFTLVTGSAEGIDQAVLNSGCQTGKVISVVAGGLDKIYPASNRALLDKIIEKGGLVLSENTPDVSPQRYHFPIRNRILAGISEGTLVVSAAKKSGTLYTANYAIDYGRDLFVIPYSIGIASGEGCNGLIKNGGMLTDNPQDVLTYYGIEERQEEKILGEQEKRILEILSEGERHIDLIAKMLNKQSFEVAVTLSLMEIKGLICKTGINVYGLA